MKDITLMESSFAKKTKQNKTKNKQRNRKIKETLIFPS